MRKLAFILALFVALGTVVLPSNAVSPTLSVSARAAALIDVDDGRVLYEKNANERLPMASTTKIMTALVALESASLDTVVTVHPDAVGVEGSSVYLTAGERLTLGELLYALMLSSANDAAVAIAIALGGSVERFAEMMNECAARLGLLNTSFKNPHGLDAEGHYTTALELARLTAHALKNDDLRRIVSSYKQEISGPSGKRLLVNHNRLLRSYEGCIGVKTGYTKRTGRCLVSAAERDGLTLVAVTLNDGDDWRDHTAMLDYGFEFFERVTLARSGVELARLPLVNGAPLPLYAESDLSLTLTRYGKEIRVRIEACSRFLWSAPTIGEKLARAVFYRGDERLGEVFLVA